MFGRFDEPGAQALSLPRRVDGQHAEVAGVLAGCDVDAAGQRVLVVFEQQKDPFFHPREDVRFVRPVADLEEVLDAIREGYQLRCRRRISTFRHSNFHIGLIIAPGTLNRDTQR